MGQGQIKEGDLIITTKGYLVRVDRIEKHRVYFNGDSECRIDECRLATQDDIKEELEDRLNQTFKQFMKEYDLTVNTDSLNLQINEYSE